MLGLCFRASKMTEIKNGYQIQIRLVELVMGKIIKSKIYVYYFIKLKKNSPKPGALVPNRNEGVRSTLLDPVEMIIINFYGFQYVCYMCSSILNFSNVVQALVINIAFWNSLNTFIITLTHFLQSSQLEHFSKKKTSRLPRVWPRWALIKTIPWIDQMFFNLMFISEKINWGFAWSGRSAENETSKVGYTCLVISVFVEDAFLSWTFIEM